MSQELRESLIEAPFNLQAYRDKKGPPDRIAFLKIISFMDKEKYANIEGYNRPIYISEIFWNKPISRVMFYNGSVVNIISQQKLLTVRLTIDHIKHTRTVIQGFDQSE